MVSEVPVESNELKQQLLKQGFLPADTESPGTVCVCACALLLWLCIGMLEAQFCYHVRPVQPPNPSGGLYLDLQPGLVAASQQRDLAGCGCFEVSVHP